MTKKESEKDSDRPHYYSQFWLDVAAGRRVIGTPKTDEGDADEEPEPIPVSLRRPVYSNDTDGYHEDVVHPQVELELEEDADEYSTPDLEPLDEVEEISDEDEGLLAPVFGANEDDIPDVDFSPKTEVVAAAEVTDEAKETDEVKEAEAEENEEEFFDEEAEEDEDDDTWSARGRKKPRPGRQAKLPAKAPAKRTKREPRRGF
jgi:hypothetical protein